MKIRVGARKSQLSLIQCKLVANLLTKAGADVELKPIDTVADSLEAGLPEGGGSQVFVKEVDEALVRGEIDVAVNDMRDVGAKLPKGISIAAVPTREDPREAFVSTRASKLSDLPKGSRMGVVTPVAHVQIAKLRPDIAIVPMASEMDSLLLALKGGDLDAFITASCDLIRMGFSKLIAESIAVDKLIPAIGQGSLSIQVRSAEKDLTRFVNQACHQRASGLRLRAERSFLKAIGEQEGRVFATHAQIKPSGMQMIGFMSMADGTRFVTDKHSGNLDKAQDVGSHLAQKILKDFSD